MSIPAYVSLVYDKAPATTHGEVSQGLMLALGRRESSPQDKLAELGLSASLAWQVIRRLRLQSKLG